MEFTINMENVKKHIKHFNENVTHNFDSYCFAQQEISDSICHFVKINDEVRATHYAEIRQALSIIYVDTFKANRIGRY